MGRLAETAVTFDLPYVHTFRDRHGKVRYYFRRKGFRRVALRGIPGTPEFLASYQAALDGSSQPAVVPGGAPGSFGALRAVYYNSAEFAALRPSTQRETRYVIDALAARYADKPIATLARSNILSWRDGMKDRPGAANKMVRIVKLLLSFAVDRGFRPDNPAKGIKLLKLGRFRAWTDAELEAFEARWPLGSVERTGFALALYTGQRRADLVRLKWSSIAGEKISLEQRKTGTRVKMPLHPELQKALSAVHPRRGETILTGRKGKPLNEVYFGALMASAIEAARLPEECVLHGLRKTTARILRELGHRAASITGHLSPQMEEQYARDADRAKMADAAIVDWAKASRARKRPA